VIYIWLTILGLALGSFANAWVWRLRQHEGITKGRSHCDHCQHQLSVKDLIPVFSWLWLKGRCRYCRKSVHWHNPLVEALMAVAFVVSYVCWPEALIGAGEYIRFVLWLGLLVGMAVIIVYDLLWMEVPNEIIYPMILAVIVWAYADALFFQGGATAMKELALGLLVGGGLFLALFYGSRGRWLGGGDVKIGLFFGAWLGPLYALVALIVGFYSAFLIIIPLMLSRKIRNLKQKIPFGPFLLGGVFVATLWGQPLVDWYMRVFVS